MQNICWAILGGWFFMGFLTFAIVLLAIIIVPSKEISVFDNLFGGIIYGLFMIPFGPLSLGVAARKIEELLAYLKSEEPKDTSSNAS